MDQPNQSADPFLNDLGGRLVGETGRVTEALEGNAGLVQVGDGEWLARGADAAEGLVSASPRLAEPR